MDIFNGIAPQPAGEENKKSGQKKAYQAPEIRCYGNVAEITQLSPGKGPDGCTAWVDCTGC